MHSPNLFHSSLYRRISSNGLSHDSRRDRISTLCLLDNFLNLVFSARLTSPPQRATAYLRISVAVEICCFKKDSAKSVCWSSKDHKKAKFSLKGIFSGKRALMSFLYVFTNHLRSSLSFSDIDDLAEASDVKIVSKSFCVHNSMIFKEISSFNFGLLFFLYFGRMRIPKWSPK